MNLRIATYLDTEVQVNVTDEVTIVLDEIRGPRGSFAFIRGHVSESKRTTPEISDKWFLSAPRYDLFLARKLAGLEKVTLEDVIPLLPRSKTNPKQDFFTKMGEETDIGEMFAECKNTLHARYSKDDSRTAGNVLGQVATNCHIEGIKCHLLTAKVPDSGLKRPVLAENGLMTVDSIKVAFYCIRKRVYQKGVYKEVNSGAPVMMRNAIEAAMAKAGVRTHWTEFSLQKRNYTALSMNSAVILGMVRDLQTAELDASMAEAYRTLGSLPLAPMATLEAEAATVTVTN